MCVATGAAEAHRESIPSLVHAASIIASCRQTAAAATAAQSINAPPTPAGLHHLTGRGRFRQFVRLICIYSVQSIQVSLSRI